MMAFSLCGKSSSDAQVVKVLAAAQCAGVDVSFKRDSKATEVNLRGDNFEQKGNSTKLAVHGTQAPAALLATTRYLATLCKLSKVHCPPSRCCVVRSGKGCRQQVVSSLREQLQGCCLPLGSGPVGELLRVFGRRCK